MPWLRKETGKWCASVVIDGHRKVKQFETRDLAKYAEEANRLQQQRVRAGLATWAEIEQRSASETTTENAIRLLAADLEVRGRSPKHVREFKRSARSVLKHQLKLPVRAVQAAPVRAFLDSIRKDGKSNRTYNGYLIAAKQLTAFLVERGMLESDPLLGIKRLRNSTV